MSNEVSINVPLTDIERMAQSFAKSGLFGIKTADQAVSLMLISQAEGMHPAIAARDYHIIQGRPALKSDAMLARFQSAGGSVKWTEYSDKKVTGVFSHPQGGQVEVTWSIEMAQKAKLTGKEVWQTYPRQMLRARVISEGIRTIFPGVICGTYSVEEAQDGFPAHEIVEKEIIHSGVDQIIERIVNCKSLDELESLRPEIKGLNGDEKKKAMEIAKSQATAIREQEQKSVVVDNDTGEIV